MRNQHVKKIERFVGCFAVPALLKYHLRRLWLFLKVMLGLLAILLRFLLGAGIFCCSFVLLVCASGGYEDPIWDSDREVAYVLFGSVGLFVVPMVLFL